MADRPKEPDEELSIRIDKLASLGPPTARGIRPKGPIERVCARIGSPSAADSLSGDEVAKIRIFNAAFIIDVVLVLVLLVCAGIAIALSVGPHRNGTDWLLVGASLLFAGLIVKDITWGMCVVIAPSDLIVRRHYTASRIPIKGIVSAEVCERLMATGKPVIGVDLNIKDEGKVHTPLVTSRSLAGRAVVQQVCWVLNVALTRRRSAS